MADIPDLCLLLTAEKVLSLKVKLMTVCKHVYVCVCAHFVATHVGEGLGGGQ